LKGFALPAFLFALVFPALLLSPAALQAQSHEMKSPTPLAPGLNKGNVDSIVGPNYYYFTAGPGHWQVHLTFHEMGFLGQPHRQFCNFDFINPQGQVSHMQIWSQGNTATLDNHGDFVERKRMLLKVSGQSNLVRLGGYYEITITGAAQFDGREGSSAGVAMKQSESLIHPSNDSLVHSSGPLVSSSGPLVKGGGGSLVTPSSGPLVKSGGTLVYPGKALIVQETPHELRLRLAADLLFDFNQAVIRPDAIPTLRDAAARIKAAHSHSVTKIEGYTDSKGTPALNMRLSKQRADAVERWLIQNAGFSASGFEPLGYGAARPVAPNEKPNGADDPAGRQLNRRVEIVLVK
jgi:outer membrane protein OmpA-like peptidoglycan-associated protein